METQPGNEEMGKWPDFWKYFNLEVYKEVLSEEEKQLQEALSVSMFCLQMVWSKTDLIRQTEQQIRFDLYNYTWIFARTSTNYFFSPSNLMLAEQQFTKFFYH